jgi:hypothetical protein
MNFHTDLIAKDPSRVHTSSVLASGHFRLLMMSPLQATKIFRSFAVRCILGSRESSVGREHGQLTTDDGNHSHI